MEGLPHYLIGASNLYCTATHKELPVFRPNDYFWKTHQRKDEEKWQTYARVMREIMAEVSGLPLEDQFIEQKFRYREILYPEKYAKKK